MTLLAYSIEWFLGILLITSSLGVILAHKPVHASLFFLLSLMTLALTYLELSAEFIGLMQILVYAGAILVLFMFVIVLFQDAYSQISQFPSNSSFILLFFAGSAITFTMIILGILLNGFKAHNAALPDGYGSVESLGRFLYVDFFFPFEAVVLLFLIASVGALYIGKRKE
jgi:NADH-quinone oxidoreductase subunit J